MSIDFTGVTSVAIPEGVVSKIVRKSDDAVLWQKSRLPNGYRELTYIECTGTQCVDTGFTPDQDSGAILDFQATNLGTTSNQMFGGRATSTSRAFTWEIINGAWTFGYPKRIDTGVTADGERHILQIDKNVCILDGETICTATYTTFESPKHIFIGRVKATPSTVYKGYVKIYSCKLYNNGTMVRDFVPCIGPDGEIGLYDFVTEAFFGNAGTGEFVYE